MNPKIIWIVTGLIGLGFIAPGKAEAEDCKMLGCKDRVGYVYMPASQQRPKSTFDLLVNGAKIVLPYKHHVLVESGIPQVNTIVTIAEAHTPLFSQSDIGQNVGAFSEARARLNPATNQYELGEEGMPADSGNQMATGTKLRILGYRTWASQNGLDGQLLFALVKVEAEP